MKWTGVALAFLIASCTKPNPRSCADGLCTDQSYPFCDVDGTLGGEPNECITVACTAGELAACRGDQELRCNATGNDYDIVQCELGCDATNGCKLCEPNETRCTNGKVATCDAAGTITSMQSCALGCFEDQPRCATIDPSNNLGIYLDMVPSPPDIDFANAQFEVDTGTILVSGVPRTMPSFSVLPSGNGVPIRVFLANSLKLNSATFIVSGDPRDYPGAAVAFVSRGDIVLRGEFLVDSRVGGAVMGCDAGKGFADTVSGFSVIAGGGGGGNATGGSAGGNVNTGVIGGAGGSASGTPGLVPLRGGCFGGYVDAPSVGTYHNGGGAIQLSSDAKIDIDATVDVRGKEGNTDAFNQTTAVITGGGGAGGSILLEAPEVFLGPNAKLLATGGNGVQGCANVTVHCGARGTGATATAAANAGGNVIDPNGSNPASMGGGGGGGLGRVRINTKAGTYSKTPQTIEAAAVTTGSVETR